MKKINLLFDGRVLRKGLVNNSGRSGVYFVSKRLLQSLMKVPSISLSVYLSPEDCNLISQLKESLEGADFEVLSDDGDLSKINAFFSPSEPKPVCIDKCPWISSYLVLHDITPLLFSSYYRDWGVDGDFFRLINSLNSEDYYFSNSDSTTRDFLQYFPQINSENIQTIPLSTNQAYSPNKDKLKLKEILSKYNIPQDKKYLFSLCSLEPRKNLIRAVRTFIKFIEKHGITDFVYVLGGGAWKGFIERLEKEVPEFEKYRDRVIRIGYVSDEDLEILYSNAEWFVYTSQYEGFGMPPLEAMSCGCPVITSNNSSLPEVVGDAGIMIDWDSDQQHIEAYEKYYYDENYRNEMMQKGLARSKLFSWEKAVDIIVNKMIDVERKKSLQPLVTIITATYNLIEQGRKDWFIQNLESVKSQTYSNIEHIVIDGASSDGTVEILKEYQNQGLIKYYSEPDTGIYDAMNKGILKAKGKYVVFLNSDDYYCNKQAVEWLVMKAEETNADAVYARANVIEKEKVVDVQVASKANNLIFGDMACHQAFLIKTEVMKELGLYDLKYKTSSDTAFIYKMLNANKKIVKIEPVIVGYRLGGFSCDAKAVETDVKNSFYEIYGKGHRLTPYDCEQLQRYQFLNISVEEAINIGSKLVYTGNVNFVKEYFSCLCTKKNSKRMYRLFGIFPILKIEHFSNKTNMLLFSFIPLLKIDRHRVNDTRVYLFNFIPILRFKKTRLYEIVKLFNVIPLFVNSHYRELI